MAIAPSSPEQVNRIQAYLQEAIRPPETEVGNVGLASDLLGPTYFTYGMYRYKVPPVPYKQGVELDEIRLKLDQLALKAKQAMNGPDEISDHEAIMASNKEVEALFDRAKHLFKSLIIPTFPLQRLLWRWYRNPFENASGTDMAVLLHFFCECRTRSDVRLSSAPIFRQSRPSSMTRPMS